MYGHNGVIIIMRRANVMQQNTERWLNKRKKELVFLDLRALCVRNEESFGTYGNFKVGVPFV